MVNRKILGLVAASVLMSFSPDVAANEPYSTIHPAPADAPRSNMREFRKDRMEERLKYEQNRNQPETYIIEDAEQENWEEIRKEYGDRWQTMTDEERRTAIEKHQQMRKENRKELLQERREGVDQRLNEREERREDRREGRIERREDRQERKLERRELRKRAPSSESGN